MATAAEIAEAYADWQGRCNGNARLARMLRGWDRTVHLGATDTGDGFTIAVSGSVLADLRAALATEAWHPPPGPDDAMLERLQQARLQAEFEPRAPAPADSPAPAGPPEMIIRIRPRPWLTRAIGRLRGLRR